jgi:hypothetical protein
MMFGGRQNAVEADHDESTEHLRKDVLWFPAHGRLFKAADSFSHALDNEAAKRSSTPRRRQ